MAYLFNQVDDTEQKQNIFAPQGAPAESGQAGDSQQSAPSSTISGAASGSGQAAAPVKSSSAGYNPAAASSAYRAAAAGMKMPTAGLQRAEGALASGNQALQDKSNAYQTKASETAKGYSLDDATLSGAVSGDDAAFQKTRQRLSGNSPALFESFSGLDDAEPNVENVRDAGNLYREEAGPNYTAGQSRLDASLLRQNPEFVARQQNILGQQKSLKDADAKARTDQTKTAQDMLSKSYNDATQSIRGRLGTQSNEVINAAKNASIAENARRSGLNGSELGQGHQAKIKDQIRQDLGAADPQSEQFRALQYLDDPYDLGDFANIDRETSWQELLSQDGADQYNRAQGLLGNSEMLQAGKGGGDDYAFDEAGAYKSIMNQLRSKREMVVRGDQERAEAAKLFGGDLVLPDNLSTDWQSILAPGQERLVSPPPVDMMEEQRKRYGNQWQNNVLS